MLLTKALILRLPFLILFFVLPFQSIGRDVNETFKLINVDRKNNDAIIKLLAQERKEYKANGGFEHLKNIKLIQLYLSPDPKSPETFKLLIWLIENADDNDYGLKSYLFFILSFHSNEMLIADADYFATKSIYYCKKSGNEHIIPYLYRNLGMAYYHSKTYSKAKIYFHKAFFLFDKTNVLYRSTVMNDLCNCLKGEGKINESYTYLLKAKAILNSKNGLSPEEKNFNTMLDFNIGDYLLATQKKAAAEKQFFKCLEYLVESNSPDMADEIQILLKINRNDKTKSNELFELLKKQEHTCEILEVDGKYLKTYIDFFSPTNEQQRKEYIFYLKKYSDVLAEIAEKEKKYHSTISKVGFLTLNNSLRKATKISSLQLKNKTLIYRSYIAISILLILTLLTFILIKVRISKIRMVENKKLFDEQLRTKNLETELIQKTLNMKEEKLTQMYLHNQLKVETQKTFLEELKQIKRKKSDAIVLEDFVKELYLKISNLIEIDKKTLATNHEFRSEKIRYLKELQLRHPELTKSELNFCVYFKLQLNSKEISGIEGITPASVRVYKTRIKHKLGIDGNGSIEDYLNQEFQLEKTNTEVY